MYGELAKMLTFGRPEETRIRGRTKFPWLDRIKQSKSKVGNWRRKE
jgi:hypothetical protein